MVTKSIVNRTHQRWRHSIISLTSRIPSFFHRLSEIFQTRCDVIESNPVASSHHKHDARAMSYRFSNSMSYRFSNWLRFGAMSYRFSNWLRFRAMSYRFSNWRRFSPLLAFHAEYAYVIPNLVCVLNPNHGLNFNLPRALTMIPSSAQL